MRGKRAKWIRKVVFSKHPKILEMLIEKYGDERAKQMTFKQAIRACKEFWKNRTPGIEQWEIYEQPKETK